MYKLWYIRTPVGNLNTRCLIPGTEQGAWAARSTARAEVRFALPQIEDLEAPEVHMMKPTVGARLLNALLSLTIWLPGVGIAEPRAWPAPRGQVLDDRYHHGYFYPRLGTVVTELPVGYRTYWFRGANWYFAGGVWYQAGAGGFIVARPPVGLVVALLPPFATTVWIGTVPYYYANDVYYRWDPAVDGYEVVPPPAGADQPGSAPAGAPDDLIIYPRNGQTPEQQAADRYECHSWASHQTGFDAARTQVGTSPATSGVEQYRRALSACLEARGYSVK